MKQLVWFALVAASLAQAQELPAGPGRELVLENCQSCHNLARVQNKQYDLEQWTNTVRRMQRNGASITDEQVQQISAYLAAHYGPAQQAASSKTAPVAKANETGEYLSVNAKERRATLTVIAGQGDANGGLNFNGAANGQKTFTVPVGWTVELKFSNAGSMPHSVMVVPGKEVPQKLGEQPPAFPGAASKVLRASDQPQTLQFKASKAGEYLLVCGVGQHASRGHYLRFVVSETLKPRLTSNCCDAAGYRAGARYGRGMITVANRIYVNPEFAEQFEARFQDRARLVDGMPGFLSNYVLRPTKAGEPYVVLTLWESREAFEAWTQSDAFRQGHARSGSLPKEAFSGPNALEVHEVISSSNPQQ